MRRRPDHPDLLRLLDLADEFDVATDAGPDGATWGPEGAGWGRGFEIIAIDRVDPAAAWEVAFMRAGRVTGGDMFTHLAELLMGARLWVEGVLLGVELERRRRRGNSA